MENYISPRARMGKDVYLGRGVSILGPVMIGDGTFVGDFVTIGYTYSGEVDRFMQQGTRDLSRLDWLVEKPTV
ncbi:MAG: hypothetical protein KJ858_05315, partial [Nanoarchaeota archaeon]|nr:hypothetical protein [Nanoarchaeota archaeon]